MDLILKNCENPNDHTLAIVYRLIKNLAELIDPYLEQLFLITFTIDSPYIYRFLIDTTAYLNTSTLIRLVKATHKNVNHISNFTIFFKEVAKKGVADSLSKTLQAFMNRSLLYYIETEEDFEDIVQEQANIFLEMALKLN